MMPKLKLQLQVQDAGVIDSFCYPYARLLLDKALELKEQKGLFEDKDVDEDDDAYSRLTSIGGQVLAALCEQTQLSNDTGSPKRVCEEIENARKFLAVFEE